SPRVEDPARFDDESARRQGRIALALMRLGRPGLAWPLFGHREDPRLRTEVIHDPARLRLDPAPVLGRVHTQGRGSGGRALLLCLGEFPPEAIPEGDRRALAATLLGWYATDPDPGVHGGLDWLLRRRWGLGADLEAIDRKLAGAAPPKGQAWYVNGQGQT